MYFGKKDCFEPGFLSPEPQDVELTTDKTPFEVFLALKAKSSHAFLFESATEKDQKARFSFVGFDPTKVITFKDGTFGIDGKKTRTNEPLKLLEKEIPLTNTLMPGLVGGAVGYFSYEYIRTVEKLPKTNDTLDFPDFEFGVFPDCIVFDHQTGKKTYRFRAASRLEGVKKALDESPKAQGSIVIGKTSCSKTKEEFCQEVATLKTYIVEGDIFQAVVSKRYAFEYSGNIESLYPKLKTSNPSPYMFYLAYGDRSIIGSSPENLIRIEQGNITSFATLAGTTKRGKTREEDEQLKKELLANPKERAEHMMLVDLTRNDIGKVALPKSVEVFSHMDVHQYSQVQHIASGVRGMLDSSKTCFDAFNAIFPAGTVSGAPKIRAMELIAKCEQETRGPYAGAVGYFGANGNMDFAIGIRTFFAKGNILYVQTGAGIVADSDPEKEYEETEHKAKALLRILGEY